MCMKHRRAGQNPQISHFCQLFTSFAWSPASRQVTSFFPGISRGGKLMTLIILKNKRRKKETTPFQEIMMSQIPDKLLDA